MLLDEFCASRNGSRDLGFINRTVPTNKKFVQSMNMQEKILDLLFLHAHKLCKNTSNSTRRQNPQCKYDRV